MLNSIYVAFSEKYGRVEMVEKNGKEETSTKLVIKMLKTLYILEERLNTAAEFEDAPDAKRSYCFVGNRLSKKSVH